MKKTLSMVLSLLVILTAMAVCSVSANASTSVDPKTLTPGSDHVIFIRDPDANGYLPGDGSGLTPDDPLKVLDHENFDPASDHPQWHLQTELYQATEMLSWTGGTVVITGPVHLGINESYGAGTSSRDVYTAAFGNNTIKFTSVYNGVDYRKTNGAKITIETPATLSIDGQSIWENVDIETKGSDRTISFNGHSTLIGKGINCYPADSGTVGIPVNYVSLSGGHRYAGCYDSTINLTVQSGTYCSIAAGVWGVNDRVRMTNVTTNLVLEEDTKVLSMISGTSYNSVPFSGNANVTINGGTYSCDIWGVGMGGVLNDSNVAKVTINGGDFSDCQVIGGSVQSSNPNTLLTYLDCSGWTEDIRGLSQVYYAAGGFTHIQIPSGLTVYDLEKAYDPNYKPSIKNGWEYENGDWYYYENGEMVKNSWREDSVGWCYVGEDGKCVTNEWKADSVGWCYLDENGRMVYNTFVKDSIGLAYINGDGYFTQANGWVYVDENWYYTENGYAVVNDWRIDSFGWCYLDETGKWVKNALVDDSFGAAYISANGYFSYNECGWHLVNDVWYFIENGYAIKNDWREDSTGWCYLGEDGAMLTDTWQKDSVGWCYLNENGYWDGVYHDQIPA